MEGPSLFSAVSTSVRQLHSLLRCIAFAPKAEVTITPTGIRFSVDEARVVQGLTFVDSKLFSAYEFNAGEDVESIPTFQISLSALLETLQIFGLSENSGSSRNQGGGFASSYSNAFTTPSLGIGGTCRISYTQTGAPFCITIQEGAVTTTCEINTYEIQGAYDDETTIPLDRNALCLKIIMPSTWLHDAIAELSGTNPTAVMINASERSAPYFALEGQGGPFGDAVIDCLPESRTEPTPGLVKQKKQPLVTETFSVPAPPGMHGRVKQRYKFDLIKKAGRAMASASKVSIRQDQQGVLSLQFMIELNGGSSDSTEKDGAYPGTANANSGRVSFVDFRFVPLLDSDSHEGYGEDGDGD